MKKRRRLNPRHPRTPTHGVHNNRSHALTGVVWAQDGHTPLYSATIGGHADIVVLLLKYAARMDVLVTVCSHPPHQLPL
jgi:hypothetical protein